MFKLAIVGPVFIGGYGVARKCLTCYQARGGENETQCFGFGPGCLASGPAKPDPQSRLTDKKPDTRTR